MAGTFHYIRRKLLNNNALFKILKKEYKTNNVLYGLFPEMFLQHTHIHVSQSRKYFLSSLYRLSFKRPVTEDVLHEEREAWRWDNEAISICLVQCTCISNQILRFLQSRTL